MATHGRDPAVLDLGVLEQGVEQDPHARPRSSSLPDNLEMSARYVTPVPAP